ncbi:hypothetical protein PoB_003363900 [Plakobranchus ocellatus]|uniref:Uncharacterized protein n=1 Tax=Plakobranchus ocellatus TaxID=259542 RepID=A0AAV4ALB7_9GAST|nr:hypothetical protein PoB_003363900 [Plakobranchus ocellatus]
MWKVAVIYQHICLSSRDGRTELTHAAQSADQFSPDRAWVKPRTGPARFAWSIALAGVALAQRWRSTQCFPFARGAVSLVSKSKAEDPTALMSVSRFLGCPPCRKVTVINSRGSAKVVDMSPFKII